MARLLILIALCVLPALVSAGRPVKYPFKLHGKVYCDTCCAGFETTATTYISGAKVRVECKDKDTMELVYSKEAWTDEKGAYEITILDDHEDQLCETVLVSSPQKDCSSIAPGRERAVVILTNNNGIISSDRFSNSLGFSMTKPMAGCAQVMQQYHLDDENLK